MKLSLQDSVATPQDLKFIILEVRQYASWYNQTAIKMSVSGKPAYAQPTFSPATSELIREWDKKGALSSKRLNELIESLEHLRASAPQITITLGTIPPSELKKILITWCRKHIEPDILVDFRFNATLLGGMVVRYGSHVYDWSFRRQIVNSLDKFPGVLRRV
jgi:hypothetical protein